MSLWTVATSPEPPKAPCTMMRRAWALGHWRVHRHPQPCADDLFVALRGPNHDAHDFAGAAVTAGAAALLVERPLDLSTPQVIVKDTTAALEAGPRPPRCCRRRLRARDHRLVDGRDQGTGSRRHAALSPTRHWGNLGKDYDYGELLADLIAVIQVDKCGGEIRALSRMVRPDAALITWVSAAHSAFFNGTEEIADAKAEIFEGLNTEDGSTAEPKGLAVLPADNPHFDRLLAAAQRHAGTVRSFGTDETADLRLSTDTEDGSRRSTARG